MRCDHSRLLQEPRVSVRDFEPRHHAGGGGPLSCCWVVAVSEQLCFLLPVHDLRQQMVALQSQLQQVQLERTTLSSKLKASQAEISSLQSVRQWYQQQLALAQEARVRLQGEMAHIQVCPAGWAGRAPRLVQTTAFPELTLCF